MKRAWPIVFLGVSLIAAGVISADAQGTPGDKVGFIDLQRTLKETPMGKRAKADFDKKKQAKQKRLNKMQTDLQERAAQLDKQRLVLKPDALRKQQKTLEKKYVELQQEYVKLERELAQEQAKLVNKILKKASPQIKAIAKKHGFSIVIDRGSVLYAEDAFDITDKVNARIK